MKRKNADVENPWQEETGIVLSVERPGARRMVEFHILAERRHLIGHYFESDALTWLRCKQGTRLRFRYRRGRYIWEIHPITTLQQEVSDVQ